MFDWREVANQFDEEEEENKMAENETNIVMLPVASIRNHPNNPRKNVGDVSELAASIKANGLMQNLTVVPTDECGIYTVIIGHRRLAAAKVAGLDKVPCVIRDDLSEKEQIATMLAENMQRTDLTVIEQAESMQMMFDLGETVEGIGEKTGLSGSTVRNRLKIASIASPETLRKAEAQQITIGQLMEIGEIEDANTRELILKSAGTKNFDHELQKAIRTQKEKASMDEALELLRAHNVTQISDDYAETSKHKETHCFYNHPMSVDALRKVLDEDPSDAVYYAMSSYCLRLYRDRNEEEQSKIDTGARRKDWQNGIVEECRKLEDDLQFRCKEAIKNYRPKSGDKEELYRIFFRMWCTRSNLRNESCAKLLDMEGAPNSCCNYDADFVTALNEQNGEAKVLLAAVVAGSVANVCICKGWFAGADMYMMRQDDDNIRRLNNALELLERFTTLQVSDEERAFINGTHPVYGKTFEEDGQ